VAEDWITTAMAVELSGYHPEHLRRLMREGKVQGRKFGIVWQVDRASLLSYLAKATESEDARWGPKCR
jgi:hypothetical protein